MLLYMKVIQKVDMNRIKTVLSLASTISILSCTAVSYAGNWQNQQTSHKVYILDVS